MGNATNSLDEGCQELLKPVMANTAQVLETLAAKEMGRIRSKRRRRGTKAMDRERVRGGEKETKASREGEVAGGQS